MRGALHLLPLCVSADDAPDADTLEALHPIAATTRADAPPLDATRTQRLAAILASVQSDIVANDERANAVDLMKLQTLPLWAQDIVRSGCFEGELDKNAPFQCGETSSLSSRTRSAHKRAQKTESELHSSKRARPNELKSPTEIESNANDSEDDNADEDDNEDDDARHNPLDGDECPPRVLFTQEERVAGTVERYSEQLTQFLDQLQHRQQSDAFQRGESDLLTRVEVKALLQTLKIMHKQGMIAKIDPGVVIALMGLLDKQVLRGVGLDALDVLSFSTNSGDAEQKTTGVDARLIARMQLCLDVCMCELLVLATREIDRRVLSEETIDNCIQLLNHVIQRVIVPCIDSTAAAAAAVAATPGTPSDANAHEKSSNARSAQSTARQQQRQQRRSSASSMVRANREIRNAVAPLVNVACEFIEQLSQVLFAVKLADRWILHFSSSMVELFLLEHSMHAVSLQQSAVTVLRSIFLQYDAYRPLILDEIVGAMIKLPTSKRHLRTAKLLDSAESVQRISTLAVSIVQSSISIREVERENARDASAADPTALPVVAPEGDSASTVKHFQQSLEDTRQSAGMFIQTLMRECLKKHEERDHRVVLENFVEDLLVLFARSEWAGAEVLLEVLSSSLASMLHAHVAKDAKKPESQHTLMALNLVGKICTSIKKHQSLAARDVLHDDVDARAVLVDHAQFLRESAQDPTAEGESTQNYDWSTNNVVLKHALMVSTRKSTRTSLGQDDARRLLLARFIVDACPSLETKTHQLIELSLWLSFWMNSHQSVDSTSKLAPPSSALAQRLSLQLAVTRTFCGLFDKLLAHVMALLSKDISSFRARVLKVLATVVDVDPMLMADSSVRAAVNRCFVDDGTSVRQAAVDLVGRHVSMQPVLFDQYFEMLTDRLRDRGISVRKRVCKIIRTFLASSLNDQRDGSAHSESDLRRKSACMRALVERIGDPSEERVVKNFIIDTFQEVWFGSELSSRQLSTFADDFGDNSVVVDELPPGWKTIETDVVQTDKTAQSDVDKQVAFLSPDGKVVRSLRDAWSAYRTPQITPSSVVESKRSKSDDTPELVATIIEVIHDMANLDWFVALLKRLLHEDGKEYVAANGSVRSSNDRAEEVKVAKERAEKIVEHLIECLLQLEEGTPLKGVTIADEQLQFLACMKALSAFCEAQPLLLYPHIELIMVHLKGDDSLSKTVESRVQSLVLSMADHVFARMERIPQRLVARLESDVKSLIFSAPPSVVAPSIKCLATVSRATRKAPTAMLQLFETFYAYMLKYRDLDSLESIPADVSSSLQRALFVTGQIGGAIDLDACSFPPHESVAHLEHGAVMSALFRTFARFLSMPGNTMCAAKAAQGLGFLFLTRARLLLQAQQDGIFDFLLGGDSADEMKLQCLASLVDLLRFEERRLEHGAAAQRTSNTKSRKAQVQGDQEADAALIGSVMQAQIEHILALALAKSVRIRSEAVACIDILLTQGLVSPLHCLPILVALETDQVVSIRDVAHSQLVALNDKFPSLLNTSLVRGIQTSHAFQLSAFGQSAVYTLDKDKREYCLLGRLYSDCIRSGKKTRNQFLKALVNQFADASSALSASSSTDIAAATVDVNRAVEYLCYVARLLCALPFENEDELLYVIYWINRYVTLKLSTALDRVRDLFASAGLAPDIMVDEDTVFTDVDVVDYLPSVHLTNDEARTLERECFVGYAVSLLIRIKFFLKDRYRLDSEKCMLYQPTNASKATDESVVQSDRVRKLKLSSPLALANQKAETAVMRSWVLFVQTWEAARDDQHQMDFEVQEDVSAKLWKRKTHRRRKSVAVEKEDASPVSADGEDDDEFIDGFAD